jgi:CheY-like chemotaxis protein
VSKKTVLIVDHNRVLAEVLRDVLEEYGYRAELCLDSGRAIEVARFVRPDALICEWRMEPLGGLGLLSLIRTSRDFHTLPVLLFTAASPRETARWAGLIRERGATLQHQPCHAAPVLAWVAAAVEA